MILHKLYNFHLKRKEKTPLYLPLNRIQKPESISQYSSYVKCRNNRYPEWEGTSGVRSFSPPTLFRPSLVAQTVKSLPAMQEILIQSLGQEDPLRREWMPTSVFLPGESQGQKSLVGYTLWG